MERRIGFVGCYSHDVILMLAKVLGCMEKKVLIRDRNKLRTLQASVPIPEGICTANTEVEYDGFFFTELAPEYGKSGGYDIELIDFGMDVKKEDVKQCSELMVVTDMLLHHIRRLAEAELPEKAVSVCIIRDSFEDICKREAEVKSFLQTFPEKQEFFLPPDFRDVRNRYVCETLHEYNIRKASPEMKDMLYRIAERLCPGCSEREIRRNIRYRERRHYR